jgi:hypothetical protein
VDKISFGAIQITAIKFSVSLKMASAAFALDFSNPRYLFGILHIVTPFLTQLASMTDVQLYFKELMMFEGSVTSQKYLIDQITKHYKYQGLRQIYRILGASDMIGNPVGYIEKVGVSFVTFAREPYLGMQHGP